MPRTDRPTPVLDEEEQARRARVPRAVAEWMVHDAASLAWEETVWLTPYLLETYVPGTGPPEDGLGKLIDREIKAAMPPHRPSEADMAAIASSGMDDVLSDYGTERMHDIIMRCATEMPLNGIYRGGVVGHIQRVIRDAKDTALYCFYGAERSGENDSDSEDGSEDGEDAEGDGDASQGGLSRDDRRALFARLSAAIEATQPRLRDGEYKELYDAAQEIHNAL
jgi:hypothetical protein